MEQMNNKAVKSITKLMEAARYERKGEYLLCGQSGQGIIPDSRQRYD